MNSQLESNKKKYCDYGSKYRQDLKREKKAILASSRNHEICKEDFVKNHSTYVKYSTIRKMQSSKTTKKFSNSSAFNNYMTHIYKKNQTSLENLHKKDKPKTSVDFRKCSVESLDDQNEINIMQNSNAFLQSKVSIEAKKKDNLQDDLIKKKADLAYNQNSFKNLVKNSPKMAFTDKGKIIINPISSSTDFSLYKKSSGIKHD